MKSDCCCSLTAALFMGNSVRSCDNRCISRVFLTHFIYASAHCDEAKIDEHGCGGSKEDCALPEIFFCHLVSDPKRGAEE